MAQSIPMHQQNHSTRLGGHAYSHQGDDNDTEREYDRLRDLARAEASKRNACFDRAHEAYERGDGAGAKQLSNEGKEHAAKMTQYNKQASEYIFRANNAQDKVADDTIDLHGQFVEEAEDILEARIRDAQARGQTHLHVIVGKGNHSANHVQKIKPRVEQVCRELGLQYRTEENEGRMYVNLQGNDISEMPPLPSGPSGNGYGGGHHAGKQKHGQQHGPQHPRPPVTSQQPQQQQGDQTEDFESKIVSKIVRKMGECCVVM
ncbi:hypothetical protein VP1G_06480 [Cytospora mali]|uniref:Smr domain-containing protein n=1 Tax=Cytospora mali TaxID=578113 RepID=A0A194V5N5_CYTMA|nr:hypothetical protein VP1G_06480 [Valsa mali var. pyri (nom. inval.)]